MSEDTKETLKWIAYYAVVIVFVVVLFTKIIMLSKIPSGSMEPTLMTDSWCIASRLGTKDIDRFDIIIFHSPEAGRGNKDYYIKRVIGLPGETVTVTDGKVYIGREQIDESFIAEEMNGSGDGVYVVPEGCYFVLGDNRNVSLDARYWTGEKYLYQYVPAEEIVAKDPFNIWPLSCFGSTAYSEPDDFETVYADDADWGGDHVHDWQDYGHYENIKGKGVAGMKWVTDETKCSYCGKVKEENG